MERGGATRRGEVSYADDPAYLNGIAFSPPSTACIYAMQAVLRMRGLTP